jgi:predicted AlkP superfamily pyrophosphatase or phosphodiesterase
LQLQDKRVRIGRVAALLCVLALAAGCFSPHYVRTQRDSQRPLPQPNGLTEHILVVSIDGLRPDAIAKFETPTLRRLMLEGSYTLQASTILPSKTLPSHTSMLTGLSPDLHGVSWNTNVSLTRRKAKVPTVFGLLRTEGYVTAAFFSKSKFTTLQEPGTLDYSQAPGGWSGYWRSDRTLRDVEQYLAKERPHLLFIHFADPDHVGHASGWMSAPYGEAVARIDSALERLLATAEQSFGACNFSIIVTADHGGHDKDHGSSDARDVTIPWIAWGRGVNSGVLSRPVNTVDTAATVLWLMKVERPQVWSGKPVDEAFR